MTFNFEREYITDDSYKNVKCLKNVLFICNKFSFLTHHSRNFFNDHTHRTTNIFLK